MLMAFLYLNFLVNILVAIYNLIFILLRLCPYIIIITFNNYFLIINFTSTNLATLSYEVFA